MKKKLFITTIVMSVAFSMMACTGDTGTVKNGDSAVEKNAGDIEVKKEKKSTESSRIVSVDKIEDYVTIAPYKGIELDSLSMEVTEEMVDERISEILKDASKETQGSKAKVQDGDIVTVSYVATVEGKAFEDGKVTYYDWIMGSGDMLPEFEEGVRGMKRGQTKEIACVFPVDYHGTELAGKEAVFTVTVQTIRRMPKLDDKWVSENSDVKTAAEYKAAVRSEMEASRELDIENELKSTAWETIVTNSAMTEYPEKDIETAKSLYHAQIMGYAESYEMELEAFVASQGMSMKEYEEQCQLYAERKVKQNLILQGIMDAEGIRLDDEEAMNMQNQLMETYGADSLAELIDMYSQVQIDESIALLKVEDFIYKNAVIVEPMVSVKEEEISEENDLEKTVAEETDTEVKNTEKKGSEKKDSSEESVKRSSEEKTTEEQQ